MSTPLDDLMADIIARIEAGTPPWRQAWSQAGADVCMASKLGVPC